MDYIFDKRLYDGQVVEYVVLKNTEKYLEIPNSTWFSIMDDSAETITTHSFRVIRRFDKYKRNKTYSEFYYIDNHTVDIDRTKGLLAKLAESNEQIVQQRELINQQQSLIEEQSIIIDDILIQLLGG